MKLIIDIDEDYYKAIWENGYIYDEDNEDIAKIIKDGTPLEEELKAIKEDMKDTFYDCKNNRYDVSMEGVLDVLDKHIKENKQ